MNRKISVGSNNKRKQKQKTFNRDDHKGCVIHLIAINLRDECSEEYLDASQVDNFITDQIPELWSEMKAGDIIEDVNRSGYRSDGVHCVDENPLQSEAEKIIKNGLYVVNLDTDYDDYGAVPSNFYAITRFPLGYHSYDNLTVNNHFVPSMIEPQSYWHSTPYYAPLDISKLKLDILTDDNIFEHRFGFERKYSNKKYNFFFVVITYKESNYLLGRYCASIKDFLKDLSETGYHETCYGQNAIDTITGWDEEGEDRKIEVYDLLETESVEPSCLFYV